MSTKVLLDTDIGSDIDDAVCLAYLLANPDCDLLGITTVSGEAEKRAQMASVLCKVAGKKVPIFPGAEIPLLSRPLQVKAHQASALSKWDHEESFPKAQAVSFMREMIRSHPGEVVLLTIGALTNAALLFAMDPEIPSLLKELVMMCGIFTNRIPGVGPREWNALQDPHATAIAYRHGLDVHRSIGLDVTCQVTMDAEQVRRRFAAPLLRPVLDFAEVWFQRMNLVVFHDPLAATTIFDDRICGFTQGRVEIELASTRLAGLTLWQPGGENPPHEVALHVDPDRFFEHYFSVFD